MSFLAIIPVLLVLVLVHELGHFLVAKGARMRVLEFGVGLPPRLFGVQRGGTIYSLNWLPLGGFVRLLGEEDPTDPESFARRNPWLRIAVLAAGSAMNALLPIVLFTAAFMIPKEVYSGPVVISQVASNSPAEAAGIMPGEIIVRVADRPIQRIEDVQVAIRLNLGKEIPIVLRQGRGYQRVVSVVPRWNPPPGEGNVGIKIGYSATYPRLEALSLWEAFPRAVVTTWEMFLLIPTEVASWFHSSAVPPLVGPIGITQLTGEVARLGWAPLLQTTAILSVNLAIVNILPIPMLDGGRLAFVLLEVLRRGKRIPPQRESLVHLVGLALLLALVALVSYGDILRIIHQESILR